MGQGVSLYTFLSAKKKLKSSTASLAQLMPLNQKLLWVHSHFTVLTIIAFGVLTLVLHDEMLNGDRSAPYLAGFAES